MDTNQLFLYFGLALFLYHFIVDKYELSILGIIFIIVGYRQIALSSFFFWTLILFGVVDIALNLLSLFHVDPFPKLSAKKKEKEQKEKEQKEKNEKKKENLKNRSRED